MAARTKTIKRSNERVSNNGFFKDLFQNRAIYLMALPGIAFFCVFSYAPMFGLLMSFKNYNFKDGILGSPWMEPWYANFKTFFDSEYFSRTVINTLLLNAMFILIGTVIQVLIALLLNEVRRSKVKKVYQSLIFLPYFISWIIVAVFLYNLTNDQFGMINNLLRSIGVENPPVWNNESQYWRAILVFCNIWKNSGYYVVIYLAAIVGIDTSLYEAAKIDGANRWQEVIHITLPSIKPTIMILLLMAVGRIFFGDFQMIYALVKDNGLLLPVTDVIDTYVFRMMRQQGEYGLASAAGMFQSVLGFAVVMLSNWIVKKQDPDSALF